MNGCGDDPHERLYRNTVVQYVADMRALDAAPDDGLCPDPDDGSPADQYQREMLGDLIYNARPAAMGTIILGSDALRTGEVPDDEVQEMFEHWATGGYDLDSALREIGYLLMDRDIDAAYAAARCADEHTKEDR